MKLFPSSSKSPKSSSKASALNPLEKPSFAAYGAAEDEVVPPMCGQAVVDKLRLRNSSDSSTQRQIGPIEAEEAPRPRSPRFLSALRRGKNTPYENVLSPATEGSKSPRNSPSPRNRFGKWSSPKSSVATENIAQFDASQLEVSNGDDFSVEVSHTPTSGKRASSSESRKKRLNKMPSLLEDDDDEEEEEEQKQNDERKEKEVLKSINFSLSTPNIIAMSKRKDKDTKEVLVAMRDLVVKQQNALKQLSEKNRSFRKDIYSKSDEIAKLRKEKKEHMEQMKKLQAQKGVAEAETVYLREELKAMRGELNILRPKRSSNKKSTARHRTILNFNSMSSSDDEDEEDTISSLKDTLKRLDIRVPDDSEEWSPGMCSPTSAVPSVSYSSSGSERLIYRRSESSESRGVHRDDLAASRSDSTSTRDDVDEVSHAHSDIIYSPRGKNPTTKGWSYVRGGHPTMSGMSALSEHSEDSNESNESTEANTVSTAQIDEQKLLQSTQKPVSREEVAVFRQRLGLIQKRREERKVERSHKKQQGRRKARVSFGKNSVSE